MAIIPATKLKVFVESLLTKGRFSPEEAKTIADSLTLSELSGHGSHGIMRVKDYLNDLNKGTVVSGAKLLVIQETPNSLMADAQFGVGQIVMPTLLQKLYAKLETQAVVSAAIRNCGHIGRIGEWVETPALKGYPGLLMVNDNGAFLKVAPPGGKRAVTSTNPVAFAIPLPEGKIFLTDMSTSAIAFGKAKLARLNGISVSPDCIQDANGDMTIDPNALFADPAGSIMPMGGAQGYKGFALSMFVDMLVAGLSGGQTPPAPEKTKYSNSISIILWNPRFFAGLEHMQEQAKKYLDFIRSCPPTDSAKPLRLSGDRMNAFKQEHERSGLSLSKGLSEELISLAKELGVTLPSELTA